jgi:hypothetical protein
MDADELIGPDGKVDLRDTNVVESWLCVDCGFNTAPGFFGRVELERAFEVNGDQGVPQTIDSNSEVYFVRNVIWMKAGMKPWGGCLCIGCLEKRLGRRLKPKLFLPRPSIQLSQHTGNTSTVRSSRMEASMTNVAVSEVISPGTLSLPELVTALNNEHKQVKECVIKGAQHAVRAGELLWQAKRKVAHGQWLEWIAVNCEFAERTAQLYMKLADDLPQLANPQRIADLSLTGAIKMIEGLKGPDENPIPKGRSSKRTDKLTEAIKNSPLAILQRAWDELGENERSIFLKQIGH